MTGRLVLLSGPSGVGKTPLMNAVRRFHSKTAESIVPVVLYTSRDPRPGEKDGKSYWFRTREEVRGLDRSSHLVFKVKQDLQALDLDSLNRSVANNNKVGFLEIYHTQAADIATKLNARGVSVTTVFISPFSRKDISSIIAQHGISGLSFQLTCYSMMQIARRVINQNRALVPRDLPEILARAKTALSEIRSASGFDYVLVCNQGEHDDAWIHNPIVGQPAIMLDSFVSILKGKTPQNFEKWGQRMFKASKR